MNLKPSLLALALATALSGCMSQSEDTAAAANAGGDAMASDSMAPDDSMAADSMAADSMTGDAMAGDAAMAADQAPDFSRRIRAGLPGMDATGMAAR